eukprot:2647661-Karenia_brevis.AAC.1
MQQKWQQRQRHHRCGDLDLIICSIPPAGYTFVPRRNYVRRKEGGQAIECPSVLCGCTWVKALRL